MQTWTCRRSMRDPLQAQFTCSHRHVTHCVSSHFNGPRFNGLTGPIIPTWRLLLEVLVSLRSPCAASAEEEGRRRRTGGGGREKEEGRRRTGGGGREQKERRRRRKGGGRGGRGQ
eukprot:3500042-Rhodomonas_salina.1